MASAPGKPPPSAAALALGADGMNMGTRFVATQEAPVHQNVKDAIVAATEFDTRLVMRGLRNTERVLSNTAVEHLIRIEREKGADLKIDDIIELDRIMEEADQLITRRLSGFLAATPA